MLLIGEYAGMKEGAIAGDRKGKEGGMAKFMQEMLLSLHTSQPLEYHGSLQGGRE